MNLIKFVRVDSTTDKNAIIKCTIALEDALFYATDLRLDGDFWLVYADEKVIGVIGFYWKWGYRNFVWSLFANERGHGLGTTVFNTFYFFVRELTFCISTHNGKRFSNASKIYTSLNIYNFRLGNKSFYINGNVIFLCKVYVIELLKKVRKSFWKK